MKRLFNFITLIITLLVGSCSKSGSQSTISASYKPPVVSTKFLKGADVSWITQMESSGLKFYDKNGNQQDLFILLKNLGFNSIRLRAWVNPADGWCNTTDVLAKAIRAKNAGFKIMVDFHYSDTWADPGKQPKPASWSTLNFSYLVSTLNNYTITTLNTLKNNGITPEWVQVGNETNNGMLWEDGRASTNMANFAALIKAGYNGVKTVSPATKVIVHISNAYDNALFRWIFDGLKTNGAQWDIIGMSLYPSTSNYLTLDAECISNINDMVARYGTPCMVVEVGMQATDPTNSRDFLTDIITKVNGVANNNGLGVFYWEPESYNWNGYSLGAFDSNNTPTIALDAFGN
jgi:arabinogalactan endo-1,4-beta-galactosidase